MRILIIGWAMNRLTGVFMRLHGVEPFAVGVTLIALMLRWAHRFTGDADEPTLADDVRGLSLMGIVAYAAASVAVIVFIVYLPAIITLVKQVSGQAGN